MGEQFSKVPSARIQSGALRNMNRDQLMVYLIIVVHVSGGSWIVWLSVQQISQEANISQRKAQQAIDRLTHGGHVTVQLGDGGRNGYTLVTDPIKADNRG